MAFRQLTQEDVARARAGSDPIVAAQLRCDRWAAGRLTDVAFTDQCDAEVVIPTDLPLGRQWELAVQAGQLPLADYSGRPRVTRNPDGGFKISGLLD